MEALILGLVEGLTEFLPISSTGHLLIAQAALGVQKSDAFNIAIQVGPIIACTLVFWKRIAQLFSGWKSPENRDELIKLTASFGLTGVAGLVAKKLGLELPESVFPVAMAAVVGAFVIFAVEYWIDKKRGPANPLSDNITWALAVAVAAGQVVAMVFPGASRSGAAIMAALLVGASRPVAVRFAFLVGIPTMFAAAGKEIWDALGQGQSADLFTPGALLTYTIATVTAWATVVWLLKYVQTHSFRLFAWYRLGLGAVLFALLGAGFLQ